MKKLKITSLFLVSLMVLYLLPLSSFAKENTSQSFSIIKQENNETIGTEMAIALLGNNTYYAITTPAFSYCSQITPYGQILFSYINRDTGSFIESDIYDINEICEKLDLSLEITSDPTYQSLNEAIIDNIGVLNRVNSLGSVYVEPFSTNSTNGESNLDDYIEETFGPDYTTWVGGKSILYGNALFNVYCHESQDTYYTSPDKQWFAKDTAFNTVIAWAISGFSVKGAVEALLNVVTTVIIDGVQRIVASFTAERVDVTVILTRLVTVEGYSETQAAAGWDRKLYFFKGDLGWTHDIGYHYNLKHSYFDNIDYLLDTGFQVFVETTLS